MDDEARRKQEEKTALANFVGSFMAKSKELESGTIEPVSKQNADVIVSKVASELGARFASTPQPQSPLPGGVDVAAQMIPYDIPPEQLGIAPPDNSTVPDTPQSIPQNVISDPIPDLVPLTPLPTEPSTLPDSVPFPPNNGETKILEDQLEFNFSDPSPQTLIILGEIQQLNNKLNKILSIVEELQSTKKKRSEAAKKRASSKKKVADKKK